MEEAKKGKRGRKPMPPELKKAQRNISVDPAIWEEARALLPGLASSICEKALLRAVKKAKRGRHEK